MTTNNDTLTRLQAEFDALLDTHAELSDLPPAGQVEALNLLAEFLEAVHKHLTQHREGE